MGLIGLGQGLCKINRMGKSRKMGRKREKDRGVSGPVVRALDSGSDGPGSSPGWGTTLWP